MDSLGGFRLVRRLGAGALSEVWLGTDGTETAAIKVFREGTAQERIDTEIEALGRVSNRHIVRLDDLAMTPQGVPCLILQRLSQWNLGRVLGGLTPRSGEAVTILAPLCLAVAELHRVGIAHGRVRGSSVLFDDGGAPVLASFGDAQLFGGMPSSVSGYSVPPAQLFREAAVAADLDELANLCRSVLSPESDVARWLDEESARLATSFAFELAERLFNLAVPEPVCFAKPLSGGARSMIPLRVAEAPVRSVGVKLKAVAARDSGSHISPSRGAAAASVSALVHVPEGMVGAMFEWWARTVERGPVSMMAKRIADAVRPVRKSVWIMAAIVTVGVVVATAMIPSNNSDEGGHAEASTPSASPDAIPATTPAAVTSDDPLAAATALLNARTGCFLARSVLCLDAVNQQGSAAMDSDMSQIRLLQEGGAADGSQFIDSGAGTDGTDPFQVAMVERLGDSVLLTVTHSKTESPGDVFSLLLLHTDDGWRIRDFTPITGSTY